MPMAVAVVLSWTLGAKGCRCLFEPRNCGLSVPSYLFGCDQASNTNTRPSFGGSCVDLGNLRKSRVQPNWEAAGMLQADCPTRPGQLASRVATEWATVDRSGRLERPAEVDRPSSGV